MNNWHWSTLVRLALALTCSLLLAQNKPSLKPCPDLAGLLISQFVMNLPTSNLRRVELRKCGPGVSETLQIAAWEQGAKLPSLLIDTTDFTVVQSVMSGRVVVIETTGGPRDQVFVLLFQAGGPELALRRVTKARATILTNGSSVEVSIPNTWTGTTEKVVFSSE